MGTRQAHGKVARARGTLLTAAAFVAIGALYVLRYGGTPARPADAELAEQVRTVIATTLATRSCTSPEVAVPEMQSALQTAGFGDWSVRAGNAVRTAHCVTASIHEDTREVVLIPALQPEVRAAMDALTEQLYRECMGREAAVELVTTTLLGVGEVGYEIRTNGPVTAPVERRDEVFAHVEAGCWIYAGSGWTSEGTRLFYVSGKGPN